MTPVSRIKLSDEEKKKITSLFLSELAKITDLKRLDSFMGMLLSESEKIMLSKRLTTYVMIEHGVTDTQISNTLHLTRITVSKLRLNYLLSSERREPAVEIIKGDELKKVFNDWMVKFLRYAIRAAGGRAPKRGMF